MGRGQPGLGSEGAEEGAEIFGQVENCFRSQYRWARSSRIGSRQRACCSGLNSPRDSTTRSTGAQLVRMDRRSLRCRLLAQPHPLPQPAQRRCDLAAVGNAGHGALR